MPDRNVAIPVRESHNAEMDVATAFFDFLQRIAVGAGAVFALLFAIWLGLPTRSAIDDTRRTTN
jgi:hypothetical protein